MENISLEIFKSVLKLLRPNKKIIEMKYINNKHLPTRTLSVTYTDNLNKTCIDNINIPYTKEMISEEESKSILNELSYYMNKYNFIMTMTEKMVRYHKLNLYKDNEIKFINFDIEKHLNERDNIIFYFIFLKITNDDSRVERYLIDDSCIELYEIMIEHIQYLIKQ